MRLFTAVFVFLVMSASVQSQELRTYIPLKLNTDQARPYIRLMERLGELTGLTFRLEDSLPPTRAKLELKNGTLDCSVGQSDLVYRDILGDVAWVKEPLIIGKQLVISTQPFHYTTPSDFTGKAVLALRESAPLEVLKAERNILLVEAPESGLALRMLLAKRADILVMHEALFASALASTPEVKKDQFSVAEVPFLTVKNLIWFSKRYEIQALQVEAAVKKLKASGEYAQIMSGKG